MYGELRARGAGQVLPWPCGGSSRAEEKDQHDFLAPFWSKEPALKAAGRQNYSNRQGTGQSITCSLVVSGTVSLLEGMVVCPNDSSPGDTHICLSLLFPPPALCHRRGRERKGRGRSQSSSGVLGSTGMDSFMARVLLAPTSALLSSSPCLMMGTICWKDVVIFLPKALETGVLVKLI